MRNLETKDTEGGGGVGRKRELGGENGPHREQRYSKTRGQKHANYRITRCRGTSYKKKEKRRFRGPPGHTTLEKKRRLG